MIVDFLSNSARYEGMSEDLRRAFEFLRLHAQNPPEPGRYDIDGDRIFALVQRYRTAPAGSQAWESHRRYFDVQYVASGEEAMYWEQSGALEPAGEYDAQRDFVAYKDGPAPALPCRAGTFAVFFPEDLHKPCCELGGGCDVVKIVVKVAVEQP